MTRSSIRAWLRSVLVVGFVLVACDLQTELITDPDLLGTIEGQVTIDGYGGVQGATVALSGVYSDTATTDVSGTYSFQRVAGGSYTVTISGLPPGATFAPSQKSAVISATDPVTVDFQGSYASVQIPTTSLSPGQVGVPYSDSVRATGGAGSYTWSVVVGSLPSGLSLATNTGNISGTPDTPGEATFTVQAATPGDSATRQLSITILAPGLQITTFSLPSAEVGMAYSHTIATAGGSGSQFWTVTAGALPNGIGLNPTTGEVSGVPTTVGVSNFSVQVATVADTATADFSLVVSTSTGILHRWRFSEVGGAGTTLVDDVGGADGTIVDVGSNDAVAKGGLAILAGGDRAATDYVSLPLGVLSGLTDATIELWASQLGVRRWGRVFDFGSDATDYLMMSWSIDTDALRDKVEWRAPTSQDFAENTMAPYALGTEYHIVMTIDADGGSGSNTLVSWYRDGVERGSFETARTLSELGALNNWLGRSQISTDSTAKAAYNELRIYGRALSASEVQANAGSPPPPAVLQPGDYCSDFPSNSIASFADVNLEGAVRSALALSGAEDITCALAASLTELDANNLGIVDLAGVQNLQGLTKLDLLQNSVTELGPVSSLNALDTLVVGNNTVSDISAVAGLTGLLYLEVGVNQITDLAPVAGLSNLVQLGVHSNPATDLSPLSGLSNLANLNIFNMGVSDLTPLASVPGLEVLEATANQIADIGPLNGLTSLRFANFDGNLISDATPLGGLGSLDFVNLSSNLVTDISALQGLQNLVTVSLENLPGLNDIQPLIDNPGLGPGDNVELRNTGVSCSDDALLTAKGVDVTTLASFADAGLEGVIRSALGLGPADELHCGAIRGVSSLVADSAGISDLDGIQYMTGLDSLNLYSNSVADLTELGALTGLSWLDLRYNSVTDIAPLSSMVGLTHLLLDENGPISDVSPLSGLTSLRELAINNLSITDISPLGALTSLEALRLLGNSVTDIGAVSSMTSLWDLDIRWNAVTDLTPLSGLGASLTTLSLAGNGITDISPLSSLTNLTLLNMRDNGISDLSPLAGMTQMEWLEFYNNPVSDMSVVSGMSQLRILRAYITQVTDFSPLQNLLQLNVLELRDNPGLTDLQPLLDNPGLGAGDFIDLRNTPALCADVAVLEGRGANVLSALQFADGNLESAVRSALALAPQDDIPCGPATGLQSLSAVNAGIVSLDGIDALTGLSTLVLNENSISDVTPLAGLTGLSELHLFWNSVSDIGSLGPLINLTTLEVGRNSISDVSAFTGLTGLTILGLGENPAITDYGPLTGLASLEQLTLTSNNIADISFLSSLTALTRLGLFGNPLSGIGVLGGLSQLTFLHLGFTNTSDVSPLASLTSLDSLYLDGNGAIADLAPLSGMANLSFLVFNQTSLSDLTPLGGLSNLETLWLTDTDVADISALQALTSLALVMLDQNASLSDIQPLIDNIGLGTGDTVNLTATSVSCVDVTGLRANGATVISPCP